jgi:hypothetical protein
MDPEPRGGLKDYGSTQCMGPFRMMCHFEALESCLAGDSEWVTW